MKYRKRVIPPKKVTYVFGRTIQVEIFQGTYICMMVHNGCQTILNQTIMDQVQDTENIITITYTGNNGKKIFS